LTSTSLLLMLLLFLFCHWVSVFIQQGIIVFIDKMLEWIVTWHQVAVMICHATRNYHKTGVFLFLNLFMILSEREPQNVSITSILYGFDNAPVCSHSHPSHFSINSSVIHAFFWVRTITYLQKFSFGTVFPFSVHILFNGSTAFVGPGHFSVSWAIHKW
jgi:hypothetical protein